MADPLFSICIITGGRLPVLDACLASLQAQVDAPPFELLVCSNGGPDVTEAVRQRFPRATVGVIERIPLGAARNFLIERAKAEWLVFLDDDVTVRSDLLRRLAELAAAHPEAAVLGGPNHTPQGSTRFEMVQGAVLASIVASGPVRRRYGAHPPGPADERFFTLCNMAVRRLDMPLFPDDLQGGEENAVLVEMSRRHLPMYYDPDLVAFHDRRPTLKTFAIQMFKYGKGRGQVLRRQPRSFRPAYAAAPALVVGLPVLAALAAFNPLALAVLALYAAAVVAGGLKVGLGSRHPSTVPLATLLIVVLHFCYGAGTIRGVVVRPPKRVHRPVPRWSEPEPAGRER